MINRSIDINDKENLRLIAPFGKQGPGLQFWIETPFKAFKYLNNGIKNS